MLRGYRGIVCAFVGLALGGAQPPSEEARRADSTAQTAPAAKIATAPSPSLAARPAPEFTAYPGYKPDPCYEAKDYDAADLCAQWRAAIAAEKAAHEARRATNWAIVATFLSVVSLIAVAVALGLTIQSNNIARETAKRQLRAYVGVDDISFDITTGESAQTGIEFDKPGQLFTDFIWVTAKNFGETPADQVECFLRIVTTPFLHKLAGDHDFDDGLIPKKATILRNRHLMQSGQGARFPVSFDHNSFWAARRKECLLHIYGRIFYRDAFSQWHSTKFYYIWEPWLPKPRFAPGDQFNGEDSHDKGPEFSSPWD